jgi:uncharacterized damage-inducible protein DinB
MDIKELFLKQKQFTHQGTLGVLAKIPSDRVSWRPAEGMLSLGEIVRHIWMSEEGVRHSALEEGWDYYEQRIPRGLFSILGEVKSVEQDLVRMEEVHRETLRAAAELPLERWEEERVNNEFNIRRKVFVMLFGINEHQIHHRAQVGAYLHILGQRASPYPV